MTAVETMALAGRQVSGQWEHLSPQLGFLARSAIGVLGLGALTYVFFLLHLNLPTVALLYFVSIVLVALHWGFAQASVLSAVALLYQCYFFIPPIYSFYVADRQNYVSLAVFEVSALLVSRLSARKQRDASDANSQQRKMAMLYEFSRKTLQMDLHQPPGAQLLLFVEEVFKVNSIAIFDRDLDRIDVIGQFPVDPKEMATNTCHFEINKDYDDLDFSRRVLRLGTVPAGALLIGGGLDPLTIDALASLISITFGRYRAFAGRAA